MVEKKLEPDDDDYCRGGGEKDVMVVIQSAVSHIYHPIWPQHGPLHLNPSYNYGSCVDE